MEKKIVYFRQFLKNNTSEVSWELTFDVSEQSIYRNVRMATEDDLQKWSEEYEEKFEELTKNYYLIIKEGTYHIYKHTTFSPDWENCSYEYKYEEIEPPPKKISADDFFNGIGFISV